jgi:hypothetical protein
VLGSLSSPESIWETPHASGYFLLVKLLYHTRVITVHCALSIFICRMYRTGLLICLLSSPPPTILHFHTPVMVGNGRGTGNGHSPLHSIVYCSIRVRLSAVPLRGPPWSAVRRGPPPAVSCPVCITVLYIIKRLTAVCTCMYNIRDLE